MADSPVAARSTGFHIRLAPRLPVAALSLNNLFDFFKRNSISPDEFPS